MADIAFLLLVFFLVATQIPVKDKGVTFLLPEKVEEPPEVEIPPRNLLNVMVNSGNKLLVDDKRTEFADLKETAKEFINNNGKNPELSDSPSEAVISLRVDRGTTHKYAIKALDALKAAYNELRAEFLGISLEQYLELDPEDAYDGRLIKKAKDAFPMKLSKAEPTHYETY